MVSKEKKHLFLPKGCSLDHCLSQDHFLLTRITWVADGRFLATATDASTICLWDVRLEVVNKVLEGHKGHIVDMDIT